MSRIRFEGTVTRVFSKGFDVLEVREHQGRQFKQKFTVWGDAPAQGSQVIVEGLLSLSVDEWTGREGDTRHSVKASVNQPNVTVQSAPEQQPVEAWNGDQGVTVTGPEWNAEAPF